MERRQITKVFDEPPNTFLATDTEYFTPATNPLGYNYLRCSVQSNNPGTLVLEASIDGSNFLSISSIATVVDSNTGFHKASIFATVGGWKLARFKFLSGASLGNDFAIMAYALAERGD